MDPFFFSNFSAPSSSSDQPDEHNLWGSSPDSQFDLFAAVAGHPPHPPSPPARRSAFSRYTGGQVQSRPSDTLNIHRRIIELLRRVRTSKHEKGKRGRRGGTACGDGGDSSRGFRHMMRERQRRERLSQSYDDLYALLSPPARADKISVLWKAEALVAELKGAKAVLQRRNGELVRGLPSSETAEGTSTSIVARAENFASAIDSAIGALRCLDRMGVKARAIRSEFFGGDGEMKGGFMVIESAKASDTLDKQQRLEWMLAAEGWTT